MRNVRLGICLLMSTFASSMVHAHGGGLDGDGCHHDRKAGGYHCHRGPLAGQSFASRAEMLAKLRQMREKDAASSTAK